MNVKNIKQSKAKQTERPLIEDTVLWGKSGGLDLHLSDRALAYHSIKGGGRVWESRRWGPKERAREHMAGRVM